MRMLQAVLALALSFATAGVASAVCESKKCPASEFGAAIDAVRQTIAEQCTCGTEKSTRKPYVKCVKNAVKLAKKDGTLTGPCAKIVKKCSLKSTCGKPGRVVCCQLKKKGVKASIAKSRDKCQKKGSACEAFVSAFDGCAADGSCASTTSTSSSTITTTSVVATTTSTTSSTLPMCGESCPGIMAFDFTTGPFGGSCGEVLDGSAAKLADIGCGGLDIGGGASTVAEGPVPNGSVSRFAAMCSGDNCTLSASNCAGDLPGGGRFNCTTTGCPFGPPLPIPGPPATCVVNTFLQPGYGEVNTATGEATITFPLNSQVFLTGDSETPCPYCTNGVIDPDTGFPTVLEGSLADPKTGTCEGGATPGAACTTTNSDGLTGDCLPGGVTPEAPCNADLPEPGNICADTSVNLGGLMVTLANATTGTSTKTDPDGFFCPGQDDPDPPKTGCFGAHVLASTAGDGTTCRTITVNGSAAGPIALDTPADVTLGSAFCIPAIPGESGIIVNFASNLPGPGAVALIGTATLSNACPLAVGPSTTTTTTSSTTSTVMSVSGAFL